MHDFRIFCLFNKYANVFFTKLTLSFNIQLNVNLVVNKTSVVSYERCLQSIIWYHAFIHV